MGRRHTYLHNFITGIINEERLHPLILSTTVILEVDTSGNQVGDVLSNISGCRKRLKWWK